VLGGGEWSTSYSRFFIPKKKTMYPLNRQLAGRGVSPEPVWTLPEKRELSFFCWNSWISNMYKHQNKPDTNIYKHISTTRRKMKSDN